MSEVKKIYLCSISGGKCIENTQKDKGECRLRKWNKSPAQQWIIETSENEANTFAFKNVSDNQYLAALQPDKRNGGKIGVQTEKQWFTLEAGRGPELFHVKCNSSFGGGKAGYLNDEWGRMNDDNKIQTYQYESNNPGFNTFYFSLAQNADKEALALSTASMDNGAARKEEMEAKEKALKDREDKMIAREKAASEKEASVKKREEELTQKAQVGTTASAPKTDEQMQQKKALEEKEAALLKREEDLENREKDLAFAKPAVENGFTSPTTEESLSSTDSKATQRGDGIAAGGDVHEACKLRRENDGLRYKLKIGELEAKLKEGACQHQVRRPPRKIDHKVVGYVYR